MNLQTLRFAPGVDRGAYRRANPPTEETEVYKIDAIKAVASLMESFTRIEQGFARTIVDATGLNVVGKPDIWKQVIRGIGKNFTAEQQMTMIEDLIAAGALKQLEPLTVTLPDVFKKTELPYFQACRLALNYRNELAHNWFLFFISENNGQYTHTPLLGADNARSKNPHDNFITVDLASVDFLNWVFNLANRLPPVFVGAPATELTGNPCEATQFFEKHKEDVLSQLDNAKTTKNKKINTFIASLEKIETV